jgi:NAD(P)H-quinone oxidoreductase subunit L
LRVEIVNPVTIAVAHNHAILSRFRNMSFLLSAPIFYTAIAGTYLLVIPLLALFYFKARWNKTGSIERVFLCFLAFFFFPGFLLISPFFNFRPEARQI